MRRLPITTALVSLIAGLVVSMSASPASAATYDVWAVKQSKPYTIKVDRCVNIVLTARTSIPQDEFLGMTSDVWLGREKVGELRNWDHVGNGTLRGTWFYCALSDGIGKFRVGPHLVEHRPDFWADVVKFDDFTNGTFTAKQGARFKSVKASRKGKVVTVSAKPQYFHAKDPYGTWEPLASRNLSKADRSKKIFKLQRLSGKKWKTVKTAKPGKSSTVTFKVKSSKKATFRIVSVETGKVFSATSKTVKR